MPTQIYQLKLFISCTSELSTERGLIESTIEELNPAFTSRYGITIKSLSWPKDFRPGINIDGQSEINRQLGDSIDIYIGILGSRFGTPTPRASSGTEEEFLQAYHKFVRDSSSVRVMFYFKNSSIDLDRIDISQLELVRQFTKQLENLGGYYKKFQNPEDFQAMFKTDLESLIANDWKGGSWMDIDLSPISPNPAIIPEFISSEKNVIEDESIEHNLGILDLYVLIESNAATGNQSIENISQAITDFTDKINSYTPKLRTESISDLNAFQRKELVDSIASIFSGTASKIQGDVSSYHESMKAVFDAYFEILPLLDSDDKTEANKLHQQVQSFRKQNQEARSGISSIRQSISEIPTPTTSFRISKDSLLDSLGRLEAEIITSDTRSEHLLMQIETLLRMS